MTVYPAEPDYARILTLGMAGAVALSIVVVIFLQVRPRFSLRGLLIAVTLVAVTLGLATYLFRK